MTRQTAAVKKNLTVPIGDLHLLDKGGNQMSDTNQSNSTQRFWITSNIGWLSVCIIAAAWGDRLLPSQWQDVWGIVGLFGVAAALGLASVAAARVRNSSRTA